MARLHWHQFAAAGAIPVLCHRQRLVDTAMFQAIYQDFGLSQIQNDTDFFLFPKSFRPRKASLPRQHLEYYTQWAPRRSSTSNLGTVFVNFHAEVSQVSR